MLTSLLAANLFTNTFVMAAAEGAATGNNLYYYIAAAILSVTVLIGISMMSKVETAVKGNIIGACSMFLAIALTLWHFRIFSFLELWVAMLIGGCIGLWLCKTVKMIQMPQMVGLLNGFGGLASMIAGLLTIALNKGQENSFSLFTAGLAICVGGLTWAGSAVAAAKLHKLMSQKPVVLKNHMLLTQALLVLSLITVPLFCVEPFRSPGSSRLILIVLAVIFSNAFGYVFAIRVGGADMPITISLLNSCSGVAGSIAGMALSDLLLVSVGGIVGASGLLLTRIMCRSMNRHLSDILLGKTSMPAGGAKKAPLKSGEESKASEKVAAVKTKEESAPKKADVGTWLAEAKNVIIVPGYGMALSQAQPKLKQLADQLEAAGKTVDFAIHPVAGRMPGHMNVLLAEVDVPYEKLHEMDEINDKFADCDLALIVGANDVINPAANTAEGTPIYGMPVLDVAAAKHVIICNFDDKPGYAGVDNPLYEEAAAKTGHVIFEAGDAKATLDKLSKAMQKATEAGDDKAEASKTPGKNKLGSWLAEAEKVIIIPGYGMALSQAQPKLKQLYDELQAAGKKVEFAIHPVAGRMPGHMNVLLAEVDVPYEKLHEMDEINAEFAKCDLALVVGANDVINPAANTAEGTPIYGMPILDVAAAKHVIICNFDDKPGYAGVDNPLYKEAADSSEHVIFEAGDAKATIDKLSDSLKKALAGESESRSAEEAGRGENDPGTWLAKAENVIIIPGYGMALSQAQPKLKQLYDELQAAGKTVEFAIHPVAGRMPGHMNVLLAEVDVPYEKLHEMQEINDRFGECDLALVVGANDVINPAANTAEGTPIYGMPILDVAAAKRVIICNFDDKPGYAGVDNPLYDEAAKNSDHVIFEAGDAKASLDKLSEALRKALARTSDSESGGAAGAESASDSSDSSDSKDKAENPFKRAADFLKKAKKVIIVPGYGMAMSQAQPEVKQLSDLLEDLEKQVEFAIHPVAGRMPGHMNVLLAEVNVPYEKLHEMQEINEDFASTDVAVIIGANDVINPAANTAEGTPIYGMPILDVGDAAHIVIMNFDLKPGYAGVDNPLYEPSQAEKVTLLLGDAKENITELLKHM